MALEDPRSAFWAWCSELSMIYSYPVAERITTDVSCWPNTSSYLQIQHNARGMMTALLKYEYYVVVSYYSRTSII